MAVEDRGPRRDLPERYGPWQTVYHRFNAMRRDGLLGRMLERLQARRNAEGLIDPDLCCVDATVTRAAQAAAGAATAAEKKSSASR